MKFSLGMGNEFTTKTVGTYAKAVEDAGFTYLTLVDTPSTARDVHVLMTLATLATDRIRIGQGVVNPTTIHPSVIANLAASINELSDDRVFVGLGLGNRIYSGRKRATVQQLRETVQFVKRFTAGEEARYDGTTFQSRWSKAPLKVYIAAHGPRTLELAGEVADGAIFLTANPVYAKWAISLIERGARRAGRNLAEIDTWARTMIYVTEDRESAHPEVGAYPSSMKELHRLLAKDDPDVQTLRNMLEADEPGSVAALISDSRRYDEVFDPRVAEELGAPHTDAVSWRLIDYWHLCGSPDEICARIDELSRVGLTCVSMTAYTLKDKLGMIRLVGEKVISRFQDRQRR